MHGDQSVKILLLSA